MDINGYSIGGYLLFFYWGYQWLLMAIGRYFINGYFSGYFINGYFYGYFINGYWWVFC
jgi:hypothetical protein